MAPPSPDGRRLLPGQAASWWGHRLRSGFVGTNTSAAAVVGLTFDVIPWALYRESREASRHSSHDLRLGKYYKLMDTAAARAPAPPQPLVPRADGCGDEHEHCGEPGAPPVVTLL